MSRRKGAEALESRRDIIERLYSTYTLPKLMKIMQSEYGIYATENIYKKRFAKWGLSNKNKKERPELKANNPKQQDVVLPGEALPVAYQGNYRPTQDGDSNDDREWKRTVTDDVSGFSNVLDASPEEEEFKGRVSQQPPRQMGDPILTEAREVRARNVDRHWEMIRSLSTPAELAGPEWVLRSIFDYTQASFDGTKWLLTDPRKSCRSAKEAGDAAADLDRSFRLTDLACILFDLGNSEEAGRTLIAATSRGREILRAEPPSLIAFCFRLITAVLHHHRPQIAVSILRSLTDWGGKVFGRGYPLPQITTFLSTLNFGGFEDFADGVHKCLGDIFEEKLGPHHFSTIDVHHFRLSNNSYTLKKAIQKLQEEISRFDKCFDKQDPRRFHLIHCLARKHLHAGQFADAEREARYLIQVGRPIDADMQTKRSFVEALRILSAVHLLQGQIEDGEKYGREYIRLAMLSYGNFDPGARCWMAVMQKYLAAAGRQKSAMQLQTERTRLLAAELAEDPTMY